MKRFFAAFFVALALPFVGAGVSGCVPMPVASVAPQTFNQSLLTAYVSLAAVQNLAADLYMRGRIDRVQAQRVLDESTTIRAALDLASTTKDEKSIQAATSALILIEQQLKARQ
jgi:hypothetical protein